MKCPNKNTRFYKIIEGKLGEKKAYEIHMKVESDKFDKWYGKGARDSFGYPVLIEDNFIENAVGERLSLLDFNNPQSFEISEKNRKSRERVNNEAKKYKDIISDMKDILTTKIAIYREKGEKIRYDSKGNRIKSPYVEKIEELMRELDTMEDKTAVVLFVDNAIKEIEVAHQKMKLLLEQNDEEIKDFSTIKNYVSAYDILDEARRILINSPDIDKSYINNLDNAINTRNEIKSLYLDEIKMVNAKALAKLSHNLSEEQILDLFETAPFDSTFAEQWMDFAGSSKDPILGLLAKLVDEQQQKTRKNHIRLTNQLNEKLQALEKVKGTTNPLKLYDEILEKDLQGNLTGHIISEYNRGSFLIERDRFFKEINESELTEKERKKKIAKFFKDNIVPGTGGKLTKQWRSAKWIKLEEDRKNGVNKELIDFYDFYIESYEFLQKLLPEHYQQDMKLPSIRKESIDRIIEGSVTDAYGIMKENVSDMFIRKDGDNLYGQILDESGNVVNRVPIFFTGNLPVNEMSFDLSHLLKSFGAMALNYDNMNEVLDVLESSREILKSRKIIKSTSSGEKLINKVKGLKSTDITTKGELSRTLAQFDEFMKAQVYGQANDDAGFINLGIIKLDTAKTLNTLTAYTSLNLLGLNFLNDFANKTQGEAMNWAEAFADGLYDKKSYYKAVGIYNAEMPKLLRDVGERLPKSKINILGEWLNIYQDYRGTINENSNRSKFKKLLRSSSLFFAMKSAEHSIASKVMIAALKKMKPLQNGVPIEGLDSMWDAITINDSNFIVDSRVTNFGDAEQRQFSRKTQEILRRNHGNFNNETAAAWQRYALLRMIGSLRKWIRPGYLRRWETRRENQFLEDTTEGSYRTTGKFIRQILKDLRQMQLEYIKQDWNSLEDFEKQNIKRTIVEIGVLIIALATISILSGLKAEDDDDLGNKAKLLLSYQANRLRTELLFFINPMDTYKLLKSPAASMSTIEAIARLGNQLIFNPTERYVKGYRKDELKIQKLGENAFPVVRQVRKISNQGLVDQIGWFTNTSTNN